MSAASQLCCEGWKEANICGTGCWTERGKIKWNYHYKYQTVGWYLKYCISQPADSAVLILCKVMLKHVQHLLCLFSFIAVMIPLFVCPCGFFCFIRCTSSGKKILTSVLISVQRKRTLVFQLFTVTGVNSSHCSKEQRILHRIESTEFLLSFIKGKNYPNVPGPVLKKYLPPKSSDWLCHHFQEKTTIGYLRYLGITFRSLWRNCGPLFFAVVLIQPHWRVSKHLNLI